MSRDAYILAGRFSGALPDHEASLHLDHNPHKAYYLTVEEHDRGEGYDWVSEDEKAASYAVNELWVLQWYPDTPVGFSCIAACNLGAILSYFEDGK